MYHTICVNYEAKIEAPTKYPRLRAVPAPTNLGSDDPIYPGLFEAHL